MVISLWLVTLIGSVFALMDRPSLRAVRGFLPAVWLLGSDFSVELAFAVMLPVLMLWRTIPEKSPRRIGALLSAIVLISLHGFEALLHSPRHTFSALLVIGILGLQTQPRKLNALIGMSALWALYFTALAIFGY
jgi:hypothetical protein